MIIEILLVVLGWVLGIATIFLLAFLIPRENVDMNASVLEKTQKAIEENSKMSFMPIYKPSEIGETPAMKQARNIASAHGWREVMHDIESRTLSFKKNGDRVNFYYTTMTVGTAINHPKKGKTQLFRKNIGWAELEHIFNNPRIHTEKGYYKT